MRNQDPSVRWKGRGRLTPRLKKRTVTGPTGGVRLPRGERAILAFMDRSARIVGDAIGNSMVGNAVVGNTVLGNAVVGNAVLGNTILGEIVDSVTLARPKTL